MIELTKVKTDVINYGAMKVYNTFLVISQDEVDPELFTQKQLEDIFTKKYDIIKVNIDFVVDEENEVVEHECLVFKLGKASDSTVTYMSNVNNEGSLSSLVLTKENDAVSLEVVEYSLGSLGSIPKIYTGSISIGSQLEETTDIQAKNVNITIAKSVAESIGLTENSKIISAKIEGINGPGGIFIAQPKFLSYTAYNDSYSLIVSLCAQLYSATNKDIVLKELVFVE